MTVPVLDTTRWPLGAPPADYVLGHARAVLPDRVLDDARVVVRGGRIAEVGPHPAAAVSDVDGSGLLCLPGLVDVPVDGNRIIGTLSGEVAGFVRAIASPNLDDLTIEPASLEEAFLEYYATEETVA